MQTFGKWLGRALLVLILLVGGMWGMSIFPVVLKTEPMAPEALGPDLDAYLAEAEAAYDDIRPNVEKRIQWAGAAGAKTPLAVIYLHGFSATHREIAPVPENLAAALGANLYQSRLAGHGRSGDAMAEPWAETWMADVAEAMAIGRRLGEEIVVIGVSTGGTLATLAAADPGLNRDLKGVILVSPNFGPNVSMAPLLSLPLARHVLPLIIGRERAWEPRNEDQAKYWTYRYPTDAVFTMARTVKAALGLDHGAIDLPVLALFSDADQVVKAATTRKVLGAWGGPVTIVNPTLTEADDASAHVIAGDIISPNQTGFATDTMREWIEGL